VDLEQIILQNQQINTALLNKMTEIERDLEVIRREVSELRKVSNDTNNDVRNVDSIVRKIESRN